MVLETIVRVPFPHATVVPRVVRDSSLISPRPSPLPERVREAIRLRHGSRGSVKSYVGGIRRSILFHGKRHPVEMGDVGQERMLTYDKDSPSWGAELRSRIVQAIKETVQSPETAIPTAFMHLRPVRVDADEVVMRLRRIEDRLVEIVASAQFGRPPFESSMHDKMQSLPVAEKEAERLLHRMSQKEVVEWLISNGFRRAMAESAVATAAGRVRTSA